LQVLAPRTRSPNLSPAKRDPLANRLSPLIEIRDVSFRVVRTVTKEAVSEGFAVTISDVAIAGAVQTIMWEPIYAKYRRRR
jgi:hypothetical protein